MEWRGCPSVCFFVVKCHKNTENFGKKCLNFNKKLEKVYISEYNISNNVKLSQKCHFLNKNIKNKLP